MRTNRFNQSPPRRSVLVADSANVKGWGRETEWDITHYEVDNGNSSQRPSTFGRIPKSKQELLNMAILPSISKAARHDTKRKQPLYQMPDILTSQRDNALPIPPYAKCFGLVEASWQKGRVIAQMEDGLRRVAHDGRMLVASQSANCRVVDTVDFTCDCPRDGLCGHLAAYALQKKDKCLSTMVGTFIRQALWERKEMIDHGKQDKRDLKSQLKSIEIRLGRILRELNEKNFVSRDNVVSSLVELLIGYSFRRQEDEKRSTWAGNRADLPNEPVTEGVKDNTKPWTVVNVSDDEKSLSVGVDREVPDSTRSFSNAESVKGIHVDKGEDQMLVSGPASTSMDKKKALLLTLSADKFDKKRFVNLLEDGLVPPILADLLDSLGDNMRDLFRFGQRAANKIEVKQAENLNGGSILKVGDTIRLVEKCLQTQWEDPSMDNTPFHIVNDLFSSYVQIEYSATVEDLHTVSKSQPYSKNQDMDILYVPPIRVSNNVRTAQYLKEVLDHCRSSSYAGSHWIEYVKLISDVGLSRFVPEFTAMPLCLPNSALQSMIATVPDGSELLNKERLSDLCHLLHKVSGHPTTWLLAVVSYRMRPGILESELKMYINTFFRQAFADRYDDLPKFLIQLLNAAISVHKSTVRLLLILISLKQLLDSLGLDIEKFKSTLLEEAENISFILYATTSLWLHTSGLDCSFQYSDTEGNSELENRMCDLTSNNISASYVRYFNPQEEIVDTSKDEVEIESEIFKFNDGRDLIEQIRKEEYFVNFSQGGKQHERLCRVVKRIAEDIYAKETHVIYELIQNADDCIYSIRKGPPTIRIYYSYDGLLIRTNENGFEEKDVRAICDIALSTKESNPTQTGKFGLGFKSVFLVTDNPMIFSKIYQFGFISEAFQSFDPTTVPFVCPYVVEQSLRDIIPKSIEDLLGGVQDDLSRDTFLWLPASSCQKKINRFKHLTSLLADFDPQSCLFLKQLELIHFISRQGKLNIEIRRSKSDRQIKICSRTVGNASTQKMLETEQTFNVVSGAISVPEPESNRVHSMKVNLAIGMHTDDCGLNSATRAIPSIGYIYAGLPVSQSGLSFHIDADFVLAVSREAIKPLDFINISVREFIKELFVEWLEGHVIRSRLENDSDGIIQALSIIPDPESCVSFFQPLAADILCKLRTRLQLPSMNGGYVSISSLRYIPESVEPSFWDLIQSLLKITAVADSISLVHNSVTRLMAEDRRTKKKLEAMGLRPLCLMDIIDNLNDKHSEDSKVENGTLFNIVTLAVLLKDTTRLLDSLMTIDLEILSNQERQLMALDAVRKPLVIRKESAIAEGENEDKLDTLLGYSEYFQQLPIASAEQLTEVERNVSNAFSSQLYLPVIVSGTRCRDLCRIFGSALCSGRIRNSDLLINLTNFIVKHLPVLLASIGEKVFWVWQSNNPSVEMNAIIGRKRMDECLYWSKQSDCVRFDHPSQRVLSESYNYTPQVIQLLEIFPLWWRNNPTPVTFQNPTLQDICNRQALFQYMSPLIQAFDRIYSKAVPEENLDEVNLNIANLLEILSPFVSVDNFATWGTPLLSFLRQGVLLATRETRSTKITLASIKLFFLPTQERKEKNDSILESSNPCIYAVISKEIEAVIRGNPFLANILEVQELPYVDTVLNKMAHLNTTVADWYTWLDCCYELWQFMNNLTIDSDTKSLTLKKTRDMVGSFGVLNRSSAEGEIDIVRLPHHLVTVDRKALIRNFSIDLDYPGLVLNIAEEDFKSCKASLEANCVAVIEDVYADIFNVNSNVDTTFLGNLVRNDLKAHLLQINCNRQIKNRRTDQPNPYVWTLQKGQDIYGPARIALSIAFWGMFSGLDNLDSLEDISEDLLNAEFIPVFDQYGTMTSYASLSSAEPLFLASELWETSNRSNREETIDILWKLFPNAVVIGGFSSFEDRGGPTWSLCAFANILRHYDFRNWRHRAFTSVSKDFSGSMVEVPNISNTLISEILSPFVDSRQPEPRENIKLSVVLTTADNLEIPISYSPNFHDQINTNFVKDCHRNCQLLWTNNTDSEPIYTLLVRVPDPNIFASHAENLIKDFVRKRCVSSKLLGELSRIHDVDRMINVEIAAKFKISIQRLSHNTNSIQTASVVDTEDDDFDLGLDFKEPKRTFEFGDFIGTQFDLLGTGNIAENEESKINISEEGIARSQDNALKECYSLRAPNPQLSAAQEQKNQSTGRSGEEFVYRCILQKYAAKHCSGKITEYAVEWMNLLKESRLPYDIRITYKKNGSSRQVLVEVKTTANKDNRLFPISYNEWECAQINGNSYQIYRVMNMASIEQAQIYVIKNPYSQWKRNRVRMRTAHTPAMWGDWDDFWPWDQPIAGDILSCKPILPGNYSVLGETVSFCDPDPEESVDESKPFLKDGCWQLTIPKSDGNKITHYGRIQSTTRTERSMLIFDLGPNRQKKYYLCEFCTKQGETVWIFHRNYAAQHIPRHHPNECHFCEVCGRLVVRRLLPSHSKVCSRHKQKRKPSSVTDFIALEFPTLADTAAQACEQADRLEKQLRVKGFHITRGYHLEHQVGYPVPDEEEQKFHDSPCSHQDIFENLTTTASDSVENEGSVATEIGVLARPLMRCGSSNSWCDQFEINETAIDWVSTPNTPVSNFFTQAQSPEAYCGMDRMFDLSHYSSGVTKAAPMDESVVSSPSTNASEKDTMVCQR